MVCDEGVEKMLKSYLIMTCIICTSMSLVTFGPMHIFLTTGEWITPLGIQFPYADQSDIAFFLDLAIQMAVGFLGIMITVSIEMSQVIVNNAVVMGSDVIELNANELSEQLLSGGALSVRTRAKFRNIMLQIQDFDRYGTVCDQIKLNFVDNFKINLFVADLLANSRVFFIGEHSLAHSHLHFQLHFASLLKLGLTFQLDMVLG